MTADWINMTSIQPRTNWNLERGYSYSKYEESYPYRVFGSGWQFSFQIILKQDNNDFDPLCSGGENGFKITFTEVKIPSMKGDTEV